MQESEITGVAFRDKLFNLFRNYDARDHNLFNYYLEEPFKHTKRTNLFLGVAGRHKVWEGKERKFTRFEKKPNGKDECLLMQLHRELYPDLYPFKENVSDSSNGFLYVENDPLVMFENMKFDCTYLANNRMRKSSKIYPIAWSYDWIIEVENNFSEFEFTLRGLLDANCNKRMGIFFSDDVQNENFLCQIRKEFEPVWKWYISPEYTKAIEKTEFCLHALVFPDAFKNIDQYLLNAKLVKWDQKGRKFNCC